MSECFDFRRIPDRINDVPPFQAGEQSLRKNSESTLFAQERADPDQMLALGRESLRGGLFTDDVGERMYGEAPGPQVLGNLTLARGVRARDS